MYTPPAFAEDDHSSLIAMIRACRLAQFVTASTDGPIATALPMFIDEAEGEMGVLYGHVARANPHWQAPVRGNALVLFMGADAYISPSWYAAKAEHGKVVPTWNYEAVEARGPVEFFDDPDRLHAVVSRLTDLHESGRSSPWAVSDAPAAYIKAHMRGIVGLRIPVTALQGKRKMSQNRTQADRRGVSEGLAASDRPSDRNVAPLIPTD